MGSQLVCGQRVHGPVKGPSSQEVSGPVAQLSGRGSAEDKLSPGAFSHLRMDDIQEIGNALHFINENGGLRAELFGLLGQEVGVFIVGQLELRVEQVYSEVQGQLFQ